MEIIYQDENLAAVNKPAGLLIHKTAAAGGENEKTLVDWLVKKFPEIKAVGDDPKIRPGIVHRLDKDTSGVIVVAKNQKYFDYLKNLFQGRGVKKTYLALVWGEPKTKSGTINKAISLKAGTTKRTVHEGKMEKEAVTEYRVIKSFKEKGGKGEGEEEIFSLLEVCPQTGRTHQIRVHLASIGHPIVGDSLYGKKENPFGLERQFLHAGSLEFGLASGSRIKLEADLPDDLAKIAGAY